jgi:hypothetical protein
VVLCVSLHITTTRSQCGRIYINQIPNLEPGGLAGVQLDLTNVIADRPYRKNLTNGSLQKKKKERKRKEVVGDI